MKQETIKTTKDEILPLSVGSTIEGKVIARNRSSLFIDLGAQGNGIIYGREFYEVKDIIKNLKIGDTIHAKIVDLENEDGYRELSLKEATKQIGWNKLKELKDKEEIIKVKIAGVNKGGLLTAVEGIAAFLPVSQLSPEHYPRVSDADKQKILKELQKFVGKTLEVKILDLSPDENKLILSEKAKSEDKIKEILSNYKKGDVVDAEVSGIADFGVFIKFPSFNKAPEDKKAPASAEASAGKSVDRSEGKKAPGSKPASASAKDSVEKSGGEPVAQQIEGLIHISELDWQLIENPAALVKIGDKIKAQIIEIKNNQVFLSLKTLKVNPWEDIEKKYKKGGAIKGKVTKFNPFGAFVQIEEKIQGLCHISEFGSAKKMEEKLEIGKTYEFQISSVEPKEYRISLKLVK